MAATTTAADGPGLVAEDRRAGCCSMLDPRQWLEPHCSFCGTFTGPFSDVDGLFTIAAALRHNARDATRLLPLLGITSP